MGIFDNVVLEDCYILEGEQAEAYKKRKAKEAAAENKKEMNRNTRFSASRIAQDHQNKGENFVKKSEEFLKKNGLDKKINDAEKSGDNKKYAKTAKSTLYAVDAAQRHERRHAAKQKANEACDFIASIDYPYNG